MNSVITTSKTFISNIQHQIHKLAVGNTTCTSTTGEEKNCSTGYDPADAGSLVYSTQEDGFHAVVT